MDGRGASQEAARLNLWGGGGVSVAWDMLGLIRAGAVDCDPMLTHM